MVKFIDPRGSVGTKVEPYDLSVNVRTQIGSEVQVALLANGFPDSVLFMKKISLALRDKLPNIRTKIWDKGNAGVPASEAMLNEIEADCQAVIAAYGH